MMLSISSSVACFSFCRQSFPTSGSFLMSQLLTTGSQITEVSASMSVLPMNIQSFRIVWFYLLAVQGTLKNLLQHHNRKTYILQHSASFMSWLVEKKQTNQQQQQQKHSSAYVDLISKVMSLLFNILFRFDIAFFLRSKCLLILWLQSPSTVISENNQRK